MLPRLSIDRSQFGRAEITVDFMNMFAIIQLKQLYVLSTSLFQVKSSTKLIIFIVFFFTQTNDITFIQISLCQFERNKSMKMIILRIDTT